MTHDHSVLRGQHDALTGADNASAFAELIPHRPAGVDRSRKPPASSAPAATNALTPAPPNLGGHRTKTVATTNGNIEVKIPKLWLGSIFPSLLV